MRAARALRRRSGGCRSSSPSPGRARGPSPVAALYDLVARTRSGARWRARRSSSAFRRRTFPAAVRRWSATATTQADADAAADTIEAAVLATPSRRWPARPTRRRRAWPRRCGSPRRRRARSSSPTRRTTPARAATPTRRACCARWLGRARGTPPSGNMVDPARGRRGACRGRGRRDRRSRSADLGRRGRRAARGTFHRRARCRTASWWRPVRSTAAHRWTSGRRPACGSAACASS